MFNSYLHASLIKVKLRTDCKPTDILIAPNVGKAIKNIWMPISSNVQG